MLRIERVASLGDGRVADYRNIRDPALCREAGLFMAEGRLNVERLLRSGRWAVRSLFLTESSLAAMRPILVERNWQGPVYVAEGSVLNDVVGYNLHRGCLAAGERGQEPRLRDSFHTNDSRPRLFVALENLSNADNVGGIFRNAWAFGAEGVVLNDGCVDPLYRKAIRVSMGAALQVPFEIAESLPKALSRMAEAGIRSVALCASDDAVPLGTWRLSEAQRAVVLVVGHEGDGLSEATLAACHDRVVIPMAAGVDSLNANTATGIALHHVASEFGGPSVLAR